jgi:spore germination protein
VFNYRVLRDGEITTYYDDIEVIQLAKDYGAIPLMILSPLSAQGELDFEVAYELLISEEYQNNQLINLISILKSKEYYGVNFIFNFMSNTNLSLYERLITNLTERLIPEGYLVFVSINPTIENNEGKIVFEKIDYSGISKQVNGILFLDFIWGTNSNPPGPVSSYDEIKTFVDYAINYVQPEKLTIGEPILAYDWPLPYVQGRTYANSLTTNAALNLARNVEAQIQFDDLSQSPYFNYFQYSVGFPIEHIVWFSDARSFNALLNLVEEYGIEGTGIWSIMVYEPQFWLITNTRYEIIKLIT